jgi:hypothetical protein
MYLDLEAQHTEEMKWKLQVTTSMTILMTVMRDDPWPLFSA